MEQIDITSTLQVYDNLEELSEDIQDLMKKAVEARDNAYAPYSNFKVGAAILLEDNQIVTGNNQENAAYPSGLCAERVAIFHASAMYPDKKMITIALAARSENKILRIPTPPCGACRQVIAEYEIKQDQPIAIYFMAEKGKVIKVDSIKTLLPLVFDPSYL
ncbi:MAG: cytidine deaminase [Flavobacteriaceae bacterium CG_4_8_14_3_um_filter_34_10]|nr:cytidine deaminase [Flavobacteriia bacterium]OIP49477.1 MAG: cytidine deaminase [Flavobacteriaceae bacterium CG2_30_34_30]PIQ18897.1 MAG: cytidine deaminase [Flavobacteriaceae bacterium CG18_big_fil_WC_8_21_14_2_50_34_36]PIV51413.1 MAG: cytidine deaminase [Flavobacteriaceae bacterium CG02_land_8_20_14_3_00_34_13]PIX09455.1 MAG: cytidine deaminase [Flavobacteriaceae bacterium CG_4_8_14_3_um_filter_34_10]PIZ08431.1 MAG: cytidine deaminase [Flavobacteriaceae bacterium CG_4_10_14_0_8_um_filter_